MIRDGTQALSLLEKHGAMLQSARGPLPSLADAIAGEAIAGSWWGHAKGKLIFRVLNEVMDSGQAAACRLVQGKVTLVHARLWPALYKLMPRERALDRIGQEHTESGAHRATSEPWPSWLPAEARAAASKLSTAEARALLGPLSDLFSSAKERATRRASPAKARRSATSTKKR